MYINTFKYMPKDVSCQLCTEYVKKLGCTALRCPWLAERIEAGVVGYREAVLETFPHERRLFQRLNLLIKHYPGSLWSNEQHERRMQYQCAVQGYRRRRDTNAYYAAMYLLTSNDDIYRRTANCFCKDGIEFGYAVLKNTSPHNYALFIMLISQMKLSRISASFHPPARAITIRNTEPNRFLLSSHELQIRVVSLRRIFRHIRHFVQSIPKSSSVSVSENGCFFMARMQNEPPAL